MIVLKDQLPPSLHQAGKRLKNAQILRLGTVSTLSHSRSRSFKRYRNQKFAGAEHIRELKSLSEGQQGELDCYRERMKYLLEISRWRKRIRCCCPKDLFCCRLTTLYSADCSFSRENTNASNEKGTKRTDGCNSMTTELKRMTKIRGGDNWRFWLVRPPLKFIHIRLR